MTHTRTHKGRRARPRTMNHHLGTTANTRERITLEIPASRKALSDWYNAEHNKRFIYWLSLTVWVILFLFMFTILPLTATSNYRVTFYLPLVIFMPLLFLTTHWFIQCALSGTVIQRTAVEEDTSYVVMPDEGIVIQ